MHTFIKGAAFAAFAVSALGLSGGTALAQTTNTTGVKTYQANLSAVPLNNSGAGGTATVTTLENGQVNVKFTTTGESANLPHAAHIHIGGNNVCPAPGADADKDGLINTAEGQPSYGEVQVSLTKTGDVSVDSALAVDRFATASADGTVTFERTFALPEGVTMEELSTGVIVTHGISELFGDKAKYDGDKKSSLDEKLPLEATIPSTCGALMAMPVGGAGTGAGTTAGVENQGLIIAGAMSLAAGFALLSGRRLVAKNQ